MTDVRDLARLAATQQQRCLGCAKPEGDCDCPRRYGVGSRVDYDLWCELTLHSEPLFRVWAEAEPMCGVPSWWPDAGRPSRRRYENTHGGGCTCGGCVPSLAQLRALPRSEEGRNHVAHT